MARVIMGRDGTLRTQSSGSVSSSTSSPSSSGSSSSGRSSSGGGNYNSGSNFDTTYASNIAGLAKANGVDTGTAAAMLRSNLAGTTQYKGGGVLDYGTANRDLAASNQELARAKAYENDTTSYGGSNYGSTYGSNTLDSNDYWNQYQTLLDQQRKAQEEAIARQTQATVDSINAYKPQVEQSYADQQKANYIANAKNQSQMGDYLGAMGYSGGMAESTMANLNNTYQNNRSAADTEKNNAILTLDQQVAQARASGDTSLADAANRYFTNYLSALQNQQQMDYQKQLQEQQNYANTVGSSYNDYLGDAQKLIAAGVPEDDYRVRLLLAKHYEKQQTLERQSKDDSQQALENQWQQQQIDNDTAQTNWSTGKPYFKPATSKSSGGMTFSQAVAAYRAGIETPAVLSALGMQ